MDLRGYQADAVRAVQRDWADGHTDVLGVAAVGSGKTCIFLALVVEELERNPNARALILAHREELIYQPIERLYQFWPEWKGQAGAVMAEYDECDRRITVATVQTLSQNHRLQKLLAHGVIDYLVTDECFHAIARTYQDLYAALRAANPRLLHLGVTATPMREDGHGMVEVYQKQSFLYGLREMISSGWLVPPRWLAIQTQISLKGVQCHDGDYSAKSLADVFECDNCFDLVVESHKKYAQDRQMIAFTPTVNGAYRLADAFQEAGIPAQAADATTPRKERAAILNAFRAGTTKVLVNVGIFTEGLDIPQTNGIHMVRPTKSDALYQQCLDAQTEILTRRGWVRKDAVRDDDRVAGYDLSNGEIRWAAIQAKVERPLADGERMYGLQSDCLDIRVTGGHRMVYRNANNRATWKIVTAAELASRKSNFFIPAAGQEQVGGLPLTDHEIRFIAWVMTDGSINPLNGQIRISQAEHQPYHEQIENTLKGCGFKYGIYRQFGKSNFRRRSAMLTYTISKGQPRGRDSHLSGWERLEPYLSKDFSPLLDGLSAAQLAVFLETINFADGFKQHVAYVSKGRAWTRRGYCIIDGNGSFADRLQSLCVCRGWRCNVTAATTDKGHPIYRIHIRNERERSVGGQTTGTYDGRPTLRAVETMPGETVWCVQNELGTLVTRRNGKVSILGNCIGRALRLAPGKEDALILDYAPLEARNLVMMGDVLGVDARKDAYIKDSEEEGEVIGGFTFDQHGFKWLEGNPMEIISRQLDYLQMSAFAWHKGPDGWLTLGLGEGEDKIERTLAISAPDKETGNCRLYLVAKREGERMHQTYLVMTDTFEACSEKADWVIARRQNMVLAARNRSWRKQCASSKQMNFAQRLGVWQAGMSKGLCAEAITHKLALRAILRH